MAKQKAKTKTPAKISSGKTVKTQKSSSKNKKKSIPVKRSASPSKDRKVSNTNSQEIRFGETLDALSKNIELFQKKLDFEDHVSLHNILNDIYKNIAFLLKLLPKISDPSLLSKYNKVYKKIEWFINSTNFSFNNINFTSFVNSDDELDTDKNKLFLEKVEYDNMPFFRVKYFAENKIICIFSDNGRQIFKCNIEPDGSQNISNREPLDFTNRKYNENDYRLIESIVLTKDFSIIHDQYNDLVLDVVNLLFENNRLNVSLSKLKHNKIFNINMNINIQHLVSTNNFVKESPQVENIPLFENKAIYMGLNNLLYGKKNVGKTYLSIEVARNKNIKKPLFIALNNLSNEQDIHYEINLKNMDYKVIGMEDFDNFYRTEHEEREKIATTESMIDKNINNHLQSKNILRHNYDDQGIVYKRKKKLNKLFLLKMIIKNAINNDYDFICLNHFDMVLESNNSKSYKEELIEILRMITNKQVTFLMIRHSNIDGKTPHIDDLSQLFDNTYNLILNNIVDDNNAEFELIEEYAKNTPLKNTIKRTVKDSQIKHKITNSEVYQPSIGSNKKKENIKTLLIKIFRENASEEISYKDLIHRLEKLTGKENDEANIKKWLQHHEEKGFIKRKDGSTYKGGIIIDKSKI